MTTTPASEPSAGLAAARRALRSTQAWWATLAARERRLVGAGAVVLAAFVLWAVAVAPAWRTLSTAPARLDTIDAQLQQMQSLAGEALALRAVAPVPLDQAQAALATATGRLGPVARLSQQGERAVVQLKGLPSDQLAGWLAEARAGARARVVEATLTMSSPGAYDGSLTLALGGAR